jgi:hypothetical protein
MSRSGLTKCLAVVVSLLVIGLSHVAFATPLILITPEEAKLPPPRDAIPISSRGVTRGPQIDVVPSASPTTSPTHLNLRFVAHGGATIDPSSVQMTYLRNPSVDLTTRIKPFVTATGLDVPEAIVPPGTHILRIDLKDSEGRQGTLNFTLEVVP